MPQPVRADIKIKRPKYTGEEPCAQIGLNQFFYEELEMNDYQIKVHKDKLKLICSSCPIFNDCLEYAIKHEGYGYWAGTTPKDRLEARRKRGIILIKPELVSKDYKGDWKL